MSFPSLFSATTRGTHPSLFEGDLMTMKNVGDQILGL